jgi:3-dehydroquinate synthase
MALDTLYAATVGLTTEGDARTVIDTLRSLGLPLWDDALDLKGDLGRLRVLDGLREFREHLGGELTLTLVRTPGHPIEVHQVNEAAVLTAIGRLRAEFRRSDAEQVRHEACA